MLEGKYKPQPVRRVEIPKRGGGVRRLGIPNVVDRFIQQAVLQVLQRKWEGTFSGHSYGFRPRRSGHGAVGEAQGYVREGCVWVVDLDLEKFFDRVNHDVLMSRVARREKDRRVLKLIRGYLEAGVMVEGLVRVTEEGTPQGGPLSPLLSNLLLDELDKELERRGLRFVRYADDCNIYVKSKRSGERVKASVTRFLREQLRLRVNEEKSAVARPWRRKFLGFSFTAGREPKRRLALETVKRFKLRVKEATRRTRGVSVERMVGQLRSYLMGWEGYFGYCETATVIRDLNSWIRRRIRCYMWKQWKRGRVRYEELRKRGVGKDLARQSAGSTHGPWRLSRSPAMSIAFPDSRLKQLGLPTLRASTST